MSWLDQYLSDVQGPGDPVPPVRPDATKARPRPRQAPRVDVPLPPIDSIGATPYRGPNVYRKPDFAPYQDHGADRPDLFGQLITGQGPLAPKGAMSFLADLTPGLGNLRALSSGSQAIAAGSGGLGALGVLGAMAGGEGTAAGDAERILAAASRSADGRVFTGPIHVMAEHEGVAAGARGPFIHGFVTNTGRFVDRGEAQRIAKQAEQLKFGDKNAFASSENFPSGELNAESREVPTGDAARRQMMFAQLRRDNPNWSMRDIAAEIKRREGTALDSLPSAVASRLGNRWAVLTGENPGGLPQSATKNKAANVSLAKYLDAHAVESEPVQGAYTDDETGKLLTEHSRLLKNVDPTYAEKIGQQFGQNSVLTPAGLHNLSSGTVNPSSGLSLTSEAPYFQLPGGKRVQSQLDFGSSMPAPTPKPLGAPAVVVKDEWRPTRRQVFDPDPKLAEYREPSPVPSLPGGPKADVSPVAARIADDPSVEAQLRGDVEQGLKLGGKTWYGLGAVRNSYGEMNGPLSFKDFNMAGGAGSIQSPTHQELANLSIMLFAKAHGIDPMEAKRVFLQMHPNEGRPLFMAQHGDVFNRAQQAGTMLPISGLGKDGGHLKVPNYYHNRMLGAEGVPLDTHEMRRMSQALGMPEEQVRQQINRNSLSYNAATQPYHRIAQNLGLAPDQVQASRWLGGGLMTGLSSQPTGDYLQTLEDGLLFTAKRRGLGESPVDLRKLWQQIAQGQEFFAPFGGSGGFPVPH